MYMHKVSQVGFRTSDFVLININLSTVQKLEIHLSVVSVSLSAVAVLTFDLLLLTVQVLK